MFPILIWQFSKFWAYFLKPWETLGIIVRVVFEEFTKNMEPTIMCPIIDYCCLYSKKTIFNFLGISKSLGKWCNNCFWWIEKNRIEIGIKSHVPNGLKGLSWFQDNNFECFDIFWKPWLTLWNASRVIFEEFRKNG